MSGYQGSAESTRPASVNAAPANDAVPGLVLQLTGPGFAPGNFSVRGDDWRMGIKGGVNLLGRTNATSGYGSAVAYEVEDFEVLFEVVPQWNDMAKAWLLGGPEFSFGYGWQFAGTDLSEGASLEVLLDEDYRPFYVGGTFAERKGRPAFVGISRDAGVLSVSFDGDILGTIGSGLVEGIDRMLAGYVGGYGEFQGAVKNAWVFNKTLTVAERAAVLRGETPAGLIPRAVSYLGTGFGTTDEVNLALSSVTATGFTADATTGGDFKFVGITNQANTVNCVDDGRKQRFAVTATVNSGSAAGLPAIVAWNNSAFGAATAKIVPGVQVLEFDSFFSPHPADALIFCHHNLFGNNATACNYTISVQALESVGTKARYDGERDVTSKRWLDSSGNGHDLFYVVGTTPLAQQLEQPRVAEFRFSLAAPLATDSPAGWTLVRSATGTLTATPSAYMLGVKPPVGTANAETAGNTVTVVTNQSTGVVTFYVRNAAGALVDDTIAGTLSHRE